MISLHMSIRSRQHLITTSTKRYNRVQTIIGVFGVRSKSSSSHSSLLRCIVIPNRSSSDHFGVTRRAAAAAATGGQYRWFGSKRENDETQKDAGDRASVVDRLPRSMQPYARLARIDKPIGTALLLWPCFWSTAIAASPGCWPDPTLLALFSAGAFIMRGAGCTINDMWDKDFDKRVKRTKDRPLASGDLTLTQSTVFLAAQLTAGLAVLVSLPHTQYCFYLGAASLPLVATYPAMKRFSNYPQLVLGLTFNWGALMGWAATYGSLDLEKVIPLYLSGVCWTLVYDTLYAHQDKQDDSKLGLKSTALHFGDTYTKPILHAFSATSFLCWIVTGYNVGFTSPWYYVGSGLAWCHLSWQIVTADLDDETNLAERFRSNQYLGAIVFGSCVVGNLTMGG